MPPRTEPPVEGQERHEIVATHLIIPGPDGPVEYDLAEVFAKVETYTAGVDERLGALEETPRTAILASEPAPRPSRAAAELCEECGGSPPVHFDSCSNFVDKTAGKAVA